MVIPLYNRIRKQLHKDIALLQDEVVEIVYKVSPKAVLHGGTAVWRCFSGNRFSEDLDFYLFESIDFKKDFEKELDSHGLKLIKFKKTENAIYSKIESNNAVVRFEAALREPPKHVVSSYEKFDGTTIDVFVVSLEELIIEKINAFINRRLVRDLYDIYFLTSKNIESKQLKEKIKDLIEKNIKPVDEKNLRAIILSGAVPSYSQMIEALKRRF